MPEDSTPVEQGTPGRRSGGPGLVKAHRAISAVFAVHGSVTGSFATRVPWVQDHLRLSALELGAALVGPAVGAALAMPLAGRLAHRYGTRTALTGLLALWCAALALPALSPGLPWLFAALLAYGAASGMADVVMNLQGSSLEGELGRSVMSGLHGMWSLGTLLGGAVGVAAAHVGLDARIHLGGLAALLVLLGLLACRNLLDVTPKPEEEAPPAFSLPPRRAVVLGMVGFCAVFAEGASMDWSGVYLKDITHSSTTIAAAAYTAFACTMALARFAGDAVVQRIGPVATVRGGGLLTTAGGVCVVVASASWTAVLGFALIGVGIAVVVPLAFAAAGRMGPHPSQSIAGVATITYTSGLLAPALIGAIAEATSLTGSFVLVTVLGTGLLLGAGMMRT